SWRGCEVGGVERESAIAPTRVSAETLLFAKLRSVADGISHPSGIIAAISVASPNETLRTVIMELDTDTVTADDLLRLPDDGCRYELLHGRLKKMLPSGFEHGKVTAAVTRSLVEYVSAKSLGVVCAAETGFKLASDPDHVRAPDVAFVRQ